MLRWFGRLIGKAGALGAAALLAACSTGGLGTSSNSGGNVASPVNLNDPMQDVPGQRASILDKRAKVKIALLLPLTGKGQTALIAKAMRNAGEMALFEIDNPLVQLIVKDTKATAEGAQLAAQQAVRAGAQLIIGPLFSQSVTAVKPIAKQASIPVIAFSSDPRVAGDGVYLLSYIPGSEVSRVIYYAAARGRRRFAALIPDGDYGRLVETQFRDSVARAGGQVAAVETFPAAANGMLGPARRIKEAIDRADHDGNPIDALFIPGDRETLPLIGSLMPYANIDTARIKLIGTSGWDFSSAGREKSLIGGWYPGPDPKGRQAFAQRYAKANDGLPPHIASLAFDAVSIAINLSSGRKSARYTHTILTRPTGFSGTDGLFRFNSRGLSERGIAVLEVRKFGASIIDPAPSAFGNNGNSIGGINGGTASLPGTGGARFNLSASRAK